MKKIALLGSTGSIGTQVLSCVDRYPERFKITALAAGKNAKAFEAQVNKYKPDICALSDASAVNDISAIPRGTDFFYGENAILHALEADCDIVFVAVVGFAGLKAVLRAIELKKTIALANKETLVAGGELVTRLAKDNNVDIIPVDSEHSAIWQALNFDCKKSFEKLMITASGGAFRDLSAEQAFSMKAADALKHPNWNMGAKITVDCATMANKGFEVIEAKYLFNAPLEKIEVLIHPQSIIHSMVEFRDGAVLAQLGSPSMEIPISLALSYPERLITSAAKVDFVGKRLDFYEVDLKKYPCYKMVLESIKEGDNFPCALSAANEAAVSLFLQDLISFGQISEYINFALQKTVRQKATAENLFATDAFARKTVFDRFLSKKGAS